MAEFVSAIVGLVAAGAATGNSLYGVIDSWRSAPAEFQSLSNSVTDLRTILDRVNELLDNGTLLTTSDQRANNFSSVIERSKSLFDNVDHLSRKLVKSQQGISTVRRPKWLRYKRHAAKLQAEAKYLSEVFMGLLGVENV